MDSKRHRRAHDGTNIAGVSDLIKHHGPECICLGMPKEIVFIKNGQGFGLQKHALMNLVMANHSLQFLGLCFLGRTREFDVFNLP